MYADTQRPIAGKEIVRKLQRPDIAISNIQFWNDAPDCLDSLGSKINTDGLKAISTKRTDVPGSAAPALKNRAIIGTQIRSGDPAHKRMLADIEDIMSETRKLVGVPLVIPELACCATSSVYKTSILSVVEDH
jgi:hypothetical protein